MIKKHINTGNVLLMLSAVIILFRTKLLLQLSTLLYEYIKLIIVDYNYAFNQMDLQLFDFFVSFILLVVLVITIAKNRKNKLLLLKPYPYIAAVILLFAFVFAPLIVDDNPDFQKNIGVTKLLPPFSSVKSINLVKAEKSIEQEETFLSKKRKVIKESYDESVLFVDSVQTGKDSIIIFQGRSISKLRLNEIERVNFMPVINTKFYLLGTDEFGRNVYARLIYGVRVSLLIGVCSVLVSIFIGVTLGFAAGLSGRLADIFISRLSEMLLSFPLIFFIILIIALFGNSIFSVIIVLGFSGWMSLVKIVKGEVISLNSKDYFITAKQLGLTKKQLLIKEVLPVISAPVIVNSIFQFGNVVLAESALSYLGLGVGNRYPSWGSMIQTGQEYISSGWWLIVFPGILIVLTLLTANQLGKLINKHFNPRFS